ncbi:MAG: hypothetical protein V3U65_12325 [Granulosicoccaceae bacterium]
MVNPKKVREAKSRSLAWLGLLLQVFGVMFGVTALIGMLISATKIKESEGSIYQSHLKWQIVTFWLGAIAAAGSYILYTKTGSTWPMIIAGLFIIYRLLTSFFKLIEKQAIKRWI